MQGIPFHLGFTIYVLCEAYLSDGESEKCQDEA